MTRRAFRLNVAALVIGLFAAILLALYPPRVPQYTEKGEPVIAFTANPTEGGKRWGKYQEWASYAGPGLLCLAFFLQLVALCGRSIAQTEQVSVASSSKGGGE